MTKDAAERYFSSQGWEEAGTLGIGARGHVLLMQRQAGEDSETAMENCALKRSLWSEVHALQTLASCKNVVRLHEHMASSCVPGEYWVRMECLEGGSLRSYLRSRGSSYVNESIVCFIISEILAGLEEIHRMGWMHRDVKAENIGLSFEPWGTACLEQLRVKLLDFDAAAKVPVGGKLSEIIGTVEYMAPEVFEGCYDERADCWSVGIVAYEALYGYRPFNDASLDHVEEMVRNWQKYLLFPFDASERPSSFIRELLTSCDARRSCRAAREHDWMLGAHRSQGTPEQPKARAPKVEQLQVPVRGRSDHKILGRGNILGPAVTADISLSSSINFRSSPRSGGEEDVACLSRLRKALSQWNAPELDEAQKPTSVEHVCLDAETPAMPLSRQPAGDNSYLSLHSSRDGSPHHVAGRPVILQHAVAIEEAEPHRASAPPPQEGWHANYLLRVRERAQEMVRAADNLVRIQAAERVRLEDRSSQGERHLAAEGTGPASPGLSPTPEAPRPDASLDHLAGIRARTQELLNMMANASASARAAPDATASLPLATVEEPSLARTAEDHAVWLASQKNRTQQLLAGLRKASKETIAVPDWAR